jgi:hypothetical protein
MQDWQMILEATVFMRLDACRIMYEAKTPEEYVRGRKLHTDAERIAKKYRARA